MRMKDTVKTLTILYTKCCRSVSLVKSYRQIVEYLPETASLLSSFLFTFTLDAAPSQWVGQASLIYCIQYLVFSIRM